jgi:hypothetical protein
MNIVADIIEFFLKNRVVKHLTFWVAFFIGSLIYGLGLGEMPLVSIYLEIIYLPIQILATYVFMYLQLPLLYKKRYWLFAFSFIVVTYFFSSLAHINYDFGFGTRLSGWHKPHSLIELLTDAEFFFRFFVDVYVVVLMATAIKLVVEYFESRRTIEHLEADKMKSEYVLLQSKMQPEFLLQTLKLIEHKSTEDIDIVPQHIADLSDILDHTLYGSRSEKISVALAIEKLKTYLRLNAAGSDRLNRVVMINNCSSDHQIAPLCLMKMTEAIVSRFKETIEMFEFVLSDTTDHLIVKYVVKPEVENTGCHIVTKSVTEVLDLIYPEQYDIIEEDENVLSIRLSL